MDPSTHSPRPSRTPPSPRRSQTRGSVQHVPLNPSQLRDSVAVSSSPEEAMSLPKQGESETEEASYWPEARSAAISNDRGHRAVGDHSAPIEHDEGPNVQGRMVESTGREADARTRLLEEHQRGQACGSNRCNHGTFSPHIGSDRSNASSISSANGFRGRQSGGITEEGGAPSTARRWFGDAFADGVMGGGQGSTMSTTKFLAMKHGVRNRRTMIVSYYFPFLNWIRQYQLAWLKGDVIAALTMASFYIPMSLSYAANLGHIPPINGLYSFVFNPIIYALLGSCPQMVVGPEAAGSLLVGSVVRESVDRGHSGEGDEILNAQIAGVVTGMAGAVIFIAGLTRLGFLDSVLSRPFLRGFISAIGVVILVDQLVPEMGLTQRSKEVDGVDHGSSVDKIVFLFTNAGYAHGLTCAVAGTSFVIIMIFRTLKKRLQPRYPSIAYLPDRFLVVALSAVFTWKFEWHQKGLEILGHVQSSGNNAFPFHWPFQFSHLKHVKGAMSTSFLIALLGFFESSVAAKSLGEGQSDGLQGISLSANRELIALGVANIVGGCFMALPAFGGYGRSKVNASTGGRTPMSSILLSIISIICVLFLLPYFYYLPKSVLSAMISVVAYSLVEECPHDILFFFHIRGWNELVLMFLIFFSTMFFSLSLGIALGVGLSVLQVIRHSTKPRIQILGKVPGTTDKFENAELNPESTEFVEGCLIVKIPEPLTFANTGDLKNRLRRLEFYGTNAAHPALPRVRAEENNKNIIFDVHGVTSIDGSGCQVLSEIVEAYVKRGVRVFFCRLPSQRSEVYRKFELSGIVESCGGNTRFVTSVDEALRMTDLEDLDDYYRDHPDETG